MTLSRRDFLKRAGMAGAVLAVGPTVMKALVHLPEPESKPEVQGDLWINMDDNLRYIKCRVNNQDVWLPVVSTAE